ncbi:cyclin-dependent protein kinase regulator pho80 [Phlyctema vagabunda]|uniref:Cyclin-dependent protein kinase regulator pho80 n=1 Tax=Phlyctema vagabunda TaxID=108571 RepID=A0ABR4P3A1_9HELO
MKVFSIFAGVLAQCIAVSALSELIDSATVYIQPISTSSGPARPLAEIQYNPSTLSAELVSFEAPELEAEEMLVRIGLYDAATARWKSSTSTTSAESFRKGYAPTFVVSLDAQGAVLGVTCKSARVDAGQTRDFGPKVRLVQSGKGKLPELNRPVVLKEGKLEEPEPEKTLFQKYWWVALGVLMLVMTAGGGE